MIGLLEAAAGLGMMLGPLLGTLLFAIGGYNFMFYSFGSFFLILAALLHFLLPKNIDLYTSQEEKSPDGPSEANGSETTCPVSVWSMVKDPNYSLAAVAGCMAYL